MWCGVFGFAAISLAGCATAADNAASGPATPTAPPDSASAPTTAATVTSTTEAPPPDYDAIYRRLHDEAVAFIMDPLNKPNDAINCLRNVDCIVVTNQALDGQFWQGIGPENLTVTSVEVLEEVSPDLVYLKVAAEAEEVIELIDSDGTVIESVGVPTGAVKRVALIKTGGDWILSSPMDGRRWTRQAYEASDPFSLVDPLDEPMTPTGEGGVTEDGISWRALVTEQRFCLEAEILPTGKLTRCLSEPQYSEPNTTINFTMAFAGDSVEQDYIVLWFGLKADEGTLLLDGDRKQVDQLFPVDTAAVFDDVELTVGVSMVSERPEAILASGPETESDSVPLDWPVPRAEP